MICEKTAFVAEGLRVRGKLAGSGRRRKLQEKRGECEYWTGDGKNGGGGRARRGIVLNYHPLHIPDFS